MNNSSEKKVIPIRMKITPFCNRDCNFCHREWNEKFEEISIDDNFKTSLMILKSKFWINEVHYTGWEPTKHPFIVWLTKYLSEEWFSVKTTSNGIVDQKKISELFASWLKSMNISVHSLNLDWFLKNQKSTNKIRWLKMLEKQKETIEYMLFNNLKMKVNTVVSWTEDILNVKEIFTFCKQKDIPFRILDNLSQKENAKTAIDSFIDQVKGKFISQEQEKWTSAIKKYYQDSDWYLFAVKWINRFVISSVCKDCDKEYCTESFYWIRLENIKWEWFKVMLCIDNLSKNTYMDVKDFVESEQAKDIIRCFD